jgi:hypothetical protein
MGWDPFGNKAASDIRAASRAAAEAAREKAAAEAKAFRFNAGVLARNAEVVEEQGYIDEARQRRNASRFEGEQEAWIAGSGFQDTGFDGIKENTSDELDLDAIIVRRQGQFRAADYTAQSELALMNAGRGDRGRRGGGQDGDPQRQHPGQRRTERGHQLDDQHGGRRRRDLYVGWENVIRVELSKKSRKLDTSAPPFSLLSM